MKRNLARPLPILWFERLFCAAIILRALNLYLGWSNFSAEFGMSSSALPAQTIFVLAGIGMLIPLLLGWLAARRRKRFAAWLILLWVIASVATFVVQYVQGRFAIELVTAVGMMGLLLFTVATILLFLAESRRWFSGRLGPSDLEMEFS